RNPRSRHTGPVMLDVLRTKLLRTNRGRPRPIFFLAVLCFLLALCFNTGLEAFGHHDHDGNGPDPNCVACRHVETPAGTAPLEADLGTLDNQEPEATPSI